MSKLLHTRDSSYASQLASPGSMGASRGGCLVWLAPWELAGEGAWSGQQCSSAGVVRSRAAAVARVCIPLCIGPGILYHWSGNGGRHDYGKS